MALGGAALAIIALFCPPLVVLWRAGCGLNFLVNILLLLLGWLPAVLHAWWVLLQFPTIRQRASERRDLRRWRSSRSSLSTTPSSSRYGHSRYDSGSEPSDTLYGKTSRERADEPARLKTPYPHRLTLAEAPNRYTDDSYQAAPAYSRYDNRRY